MNENLKYKRCEIRNKADYWYNIILGGFLCFMLLFFIGNLYFSKFKLEYLNIPYAFFCLLVIAYYQWKDDNFETTATGLTIKTNFEITAKALEQLNWKYKKRGNEIVLLEKNKYLLQFLEITLIPGSKIIYYNFKYRSDSKSGRLPFFFGICSLMKWKFKRKLALQLKKLPVEIEAITHQ